MNHWIKKTIDDAETHFQEWKKVRAKDSDLNWSCVVGFDEEAKKYKFELSLILKKTRYSYVNFVNLMELAGETYNKTIFMFQLSVDCARILREAISPIEGSGVTKDVLDGSKS